jgi:hypothetical protein
LFNSLLGLLILTTGASASGDLTDKEGLALTWLGIFALAALVILVTGLPEKVIHPARTAVTFDAKLPLKGVLKIKHIHNGEEVEISTETAVLLDAIEKLTALEKTRPKGLFEPRFYLDGWKIRRVP